MRRLHQVSILTVGPDLDHPLHRGVIGEVHCVVLLRQRIRAAHAVGDVVGAKGRIQGDGLAIRAAGFHHTVHDVDGFAGLGMLQEVLRADLSAWQEGELHAQGQLIDALGFDVQVDSVGALDDVQGGVQGLSGSR